MTKERLGTCLWVGDHQSRWTGPLFERCTAAYAQIAVRADVADAVRRGCQGVSRILVLRIHSGEIDRGGIQRLAERHPSARLMEIRGPIAEAFYRFADPLFHDGHQRWNVAGSALGLESRPAAKSVLVVAPDFACAAPLIQAAASGGMTATWTRHPHPETVCGMEEIWWHDASLSEAGTSETGTSETGTSETGPVDTGTSDTGPGVRADAAPNDATGNGDRRCVETTRSPAFSQFPNVTHVGIQTGPAPLAGPAPLDRQAGFDRVVVFPGDLGPLIGGASAQRPRSIADDSRRVA